MKKLFSHFGSIGLFIFIFFLLVGIFQTQDRTPSVLSQTTLQTENHIIPAGKLGVIFADVGQGDSIIIVTPDRKAALIDTGDSYYGYALPNIKDILQSNRISSLEYLVITHPHQDHIGNIMPVLKSYPISSILMTGVVYNNDTYAEALQFIDSKHLTTQKVRAGNTFNLGEEVTITALSPFDPTNEDNVNNTSIVLRLSYKGFHAVLTGDAEKELETKILKEKKQIDADVLKVGHHGSNTASSDFFLSAVSPKIAVISVGKDNPYNHPSQETIQRLEKRGIMTYLTSLSGTISILSDGNTYEVKTDK